jgi:uncharacterized protein YegJ (DUF2314 family)
MQGGEEPMGELIRGSAAPSRGRWLAGAAVAIAAAVALSQVMWSPPARTAAARAEPASAAEAPARADWPAGPLRAETVELRFTLVHPDAAAAARGEALVRTLAARHLPGFAVVAEAEGDARPAAGARTLSLRRREAVALTAEDLEGMSDRLDDGARARLREGRPALELRVRAPAAEPAALRGLLALLAEAATALDAVVIDREARTVSTAARFAQVAARAFQGDLPIVRRHVMIYSYDRGDGVLRSHTVGMAKLGLPDVVVGAHRAVDRLLVGELVNLVCQWLAEHGEVARAGELELDVRATRADEVREEAVAALLPNARPRTVLTVARALREEGDADNRHLELTFGGFPGTALEREAAAVSAVFGVKDEVQRIQHTDTLLAESARARQRLLGLKPWWPDRKPGEHLMVKAPFQTAAGGNEWMWLEVTAWQGSRLSGPLANEPEEVPGLHEGAVVEVEEGQVFDYLLHRADGREEGNTTEPLLGH